MVLCCFFVVFFVIVDVVVLKEMGTSRNEVTKCTKKYKYHDLIDAEITNKQSQFRKATETFG